ncbi:hypothetical protein AKG10_33035 [Shinella sp. GWS1]|nr:hypothetical protein AKG10_33035 [Shinella sp. GWS1]
MDRILAAATMYIATSTMVAEHVDGKVRIHSAGEKPYRRTGKLLGNRLEHSPSMVLMIIKKVVFGRNTTIEDYHIEKLLRDCGKRSQSTMPPSHLAAVDAANCLFDRCGKIDVVLN